VVRQARLATFFIFSGKKHKNKQNKNKQTNKHKQNKQADKQKQKPGRPLWLRCVE